MRKLLAAALCAVSFVASAQSVRQSGTVTPGHTSVWVAPGVIADGGAPGAAIITGASTVNDFVCIGMSGTLIDCGLSATATNNWSGLQNFNGGATAPTRSAGDSTTNVATTAFVAGAITPLPANSVTNSQLAQMAAYTTKCNNTAALANAVDCTVSQFKAMTTLPISVTDPAYGAKCDKSTDDTTAFQNAFNAINGGTLLIPTGCAVAGPVTITHPVRVQCTSNYLDSTAGNINHTSVSSDLFVVNTSEYTFDSCYFNQAGIATTSRGIVVGTDAKTITDGTCTNASTTFTSTAQAAFTSADVGKTINLTNCGASGATPFFTQISAFTNSTTVTLLSAPTCGGSCPGAGAATAKYGQVYLFGKILNSQIVGFNKSVYFIDAAQWNISNTYVLSNIGIQIENQLNPDYGTNTITSSYIASQGTSAGQYGVWWLSGGDLFVTGTKVLNGQYGIYWNSNLGLTGNFTFAGSSVENCGTYGMFFSNAAQFNNVMLSGSEIACGAPNILFDNSSGAVVSSATIIGMTLVGGGGTAIDAGKVNYLNATGNTISTGGGNPAINVRSNCSSCLFVANKIIGAASKYANASATAVVSQQDQNPTTQTFLSGSGTYTTPANVTWIEAKLVGGGGGGAGSGTTPSAAGNGGGTCWNTTGAACTSPVYEAGGGALGPVNGGAAAGGTVSGTTTCFEAIPGGNSGNGTGTMNQPGGDGGISTLGGAGKGGSVGAAGNAAATNSGSGGGGASDTSTVNGGSGGGAGATCRFIIGAPASTYTYVVGAAGAAGGAGGSGFAGAAGAAGFISVIEHYN